MKLLLIIQLVFLVFLSSCFPEENITVKGKKPIYISESSFNEVKSQAAKSFTTVGKIYKLGNRIFISDVGTGVHIIDNSNPELPIKDAFISIYGNFDMAVKNNIMYVDNAANLLAIDISDVNNVEVSKLVKDVYTNTSNQNFPSSFTGYFECADISRGMVIDWVDADLLNPDCKR